jgi:hypothetical protein
MKPASQTAPVVVWFLPFLFPCYDGLATLYLDAGKHAEAEAYLMKSQQLCEQAGLDRDALMVLPSYVSVAGRRS